MLSTLFTPSDHYISSPSHPLFSSLSHSPLSFTCTIHFSFPILLFCYPPGFPIFFFLMLFILLSIFIYISFNPPLLASLLLVSIWHLSFTSQSASSPPPLTPWEIPIRTAAVCIRCNMHHCLICSSNTTELVHTAQKTTDFTANPGLRVQHSVGLCWWDCGNEE